jgi:hypothetical protein
MDVDKDFFCEDLKIGDYVFFGSYNDIPIIWRVVSLDQEGNPLLFSVYIITFKTFDSAGHHHGSTSLNREKYGSNYWAGSNLRQWLNSKDKRIDWLQNPPTKENMWEGHNPYDHEKGFLANGNFKESDRQLIKLVKNKVLLDEFDVNKKVGGTEVFEVDYEEDLLGAYNNYSTSYYMDVEDYVFCPSIEQLVECIWDNSNLLGDNFEVGLPREDAVLKSTYKNFENQSHGWFYWLNTPSASSQILVCCIKGEGIVHDLQANFVTVGVRPALELSRDYKKHIKRGSGTINNPFVIDTT